MRTLPSLALTIMLLLVGVPAFAKGKPAAKTAEAANREAREREARGACLNGDYARGVALLSELFLDFKDPNYIFNQGRCYEQNQQLADAVARFREYVRTTTGDKTVAEQHIAECEALLNRSAPPASPPPVEPVASTPQPSTPIPPAAPAPRPAADLEQQTTSAPPGSRLRVAGVVVASVGVAGLVTGLVLNLKANSLASSIDPPAHTFDRSTESTRKSYEAGSWIGYGVGAAGVVAGAILYGIGRAQAGRSTEVAVFPSIASSFAGAAVAGTF